MRSVRAHAGGVAPRKRERSGARRRGDGRLAVRTADVERLADIFGARLLRVARDSAAHGRGPADGGSGSAAGNAYGTSCYAFALDYVAMRWPGAAAKTRDEVSEGLCAITRAMLVDVPGRPRPEVLQRALRRWAFVLPGPGQRELPSEARAVLRWVAGASRPLADLRDPTVMRGVLEALRLKLDGTAAAAETQRRKRKILVNVVQYAIERGELHDSPITKIHWRPPQTVKQVDPRVVANPEQARSLLCAVSYVGGYRRARGRRLVGLFAGMYYAGLRPAEAVAVALPDCDLPADGWGSAILHRTLPQAGRRWTDTGRRHDERGLKSRPPGDTRVAPLPPQVVALWRESVDTFGTADDGRLFFNERGGILCSTTYGRVWSEARALGLPPNLAASPLAARPYDLRHSALSTWLNAGVDPTEVAERANNSVEVLLARYAKCLYGRQTVANERIEALLHEFE